MKIVLTGATGYLGGFLCRALTDAGHQVGAVHLNRLEKFGLCANEGLVKRFFLSEMSIEEIVRNFRPHGVIHTATLYGRGDESISDMINANVVFPVRTLLSAIDVCGPNGFFINTDSILTRFISTYSVTKGAFSDWLRFYSDRIRTIDIKLDHFYGPGDRGNKFIVKMLKDLRANIDAIDLTEGSQTRDFIYVDDVVAVFLCVLENLDKFEPGDLSVLEVGTGIRVSIRYVVTKLKELTRSRSHLNFGAVPYRKNEMLDYGINSTAIRLLGWRPRVTIDEGLKRCVEAEGGL